MKIKLSVTIIFVLFFCKLFPQQSKNNSISNVDNILLQLKKENKFKAYAITAHEISLEYYKKDDFKNAIKYALEEVKFKNYLPLKKQKNSLFNLGLFFFKEQQYSKSIEVYNKVIDSFNIDEKTYLAYCENARNYQKLGDFFQAKNYFKKGLANSNKITTKKLSKIYLNSITLNNKISDRQSIKDNRKLLKIVDSLSKIIPLNNNSCYHLYNEYGIFYKNELNYNFKKSKHYYLKFFKKAIKDNNAEMIAKSSSNLVFLLNKEKKDSAIHYINIGLKHTKKNTSRIRLNMHKAEYYYNCKKTNTALKIIQESLQLTLPHRIDSSITFSPHYEDLILSKDKFLSFITLKEKAKYIINSLETSTNKDLLQTAYESILLADKLIDIIKNDSSENESKLLWQKEASEVFMLGVRICFKLNKHDEAFYFIEKNKTLLLLENIKENKIKTNLPIDIIQKDLDFKKEIYALENGLKSNTRKEQKVMYHSLKIKHNLFIESLKEKYPKYYSSKQPIIIKTIEFFKENLNKDTTILEFIIEKDQGFVLAISKENTQLFELTETKELETEIEAFINLINNPLITQKEHTNYRTLANKLYNRLFPFKKEKILKKKLLIIPDYTLQNLPFESLKRNDRFLIEDYEISYAYSSSFLEKNKNISRNAKQSFISFAPITFNYDNLTTLNRTALETKTIGEKLNGLALLNNDANKETFFSNINNYKIIHLSTHANANDSISPWIAFKNKKLYLNELYTAKNQAELVVLNACNSSLGHDNKGEGVFSLARGFFYSGSNSVISSLWNVNDKSYSQITTSFYNYLKDGKTKSAALRQAKLDYLNTHSLSEASPYYWSSLILIGDSSAIDLKNNNWIYYLILVLVILLLLFLLKKTKIKGNKF